MCCDTTRPLQLNLSPRKRNGSGTGRVSEADSPENACCNEELVGYDQLPNANSSPTW
jgi:hypothetical protein